MLGKQAWRFIDQPNALVSRLYRAKYFPHGDFFTANLGHNPSYAWKSIWSSKAVMKAGVRWSVGDGTQVPVWGASWLRSGHILQCPPQYEDQLSNLCVRDLWLPNKKVWNEQMIRGMFPHQTAKIITDMPLFPAVKTDRIIWYHNPNGIYSVRSAYKVAMNQLIDASHLHVEGDWNLLWNLQAPPRVKMMLWRACRRCIPTRDQLQRRGIQCTNQCVLCDSSSESPLHSLITCPSVRSVWMQQQLWLPIQTVLQSAADFAEVCFGLLNSLLVQQRSTFAMTIWSVWPMRNERLWEGKTTPSQHVVTRANQYLSDWLMARQQRHNQQHQTSHSSGSNDTVWQPPQSHFLKINVDAAFSVELNRTGFGICCRDHLGIFQVATIDYMPHCLPTFEGEAIGLLKALQLAEELELDHVIFEVDCQVVANSISSPKMNNSEFGSIIKECLEILSKFPNFNISFSRRQANNAGHCLAKEALLIASHQVFLSCPTLY